MEQFLQQYPMHTQIPVAWGDMDALQHVNNVIYFRYFETARIDFFKQLNLLERAQQTGMGPVISENQARYRRPVVFPDSLYVGIKISDIEEDRFIMHYEVFSQAQQSIVTTGSSSVVMFNFKTGKKTKLTPELLDILHTHQVTTN